MQRRQFLMTASVAGVLAGCNMLPGGGGGEVTVQDIITYIKDKCAFLADSKDIINVILTIVTGFNPSAGAAATVAVAVADTVKNLVCGALDKQMAQDKADRKAVAPGQPTKIVVNGVTVSGQYVGK